MLIGQRMSGAAQLRMLLDDIPQQKVREILGVSDRTMRRWLAGDTAIPQAIFQALYWHTRWGDSELQSRYGFESSVLRSLLAAHRGQLARLAVLPAANAPAWAPPLQLVSPGAGLQA